MFYLNSFIKFANYYRVKAGLYFGVIALLAISLSGEKTIDLAIKNALNYKKSYYYFHALVDDHKDISEIKEKLITLPGVNHIELIGAKKLNEGMNNILGKLNTKLPSSLKGKRYSGLKIFLSSTLPERSRDLIQKYVVKYVGETKVDISRIKKSGNDEVLEKGLIRKLLTKHGVKGIWLFLVATWLTLFFFTRKDIVNFHYLLKSYRRSGDFLIPFVSVHIIIFAVAFILSLSLNGLSLTNLFICLLIPLGVSAGLYVKRSWIH